MTQFSIFFFFSEKMASGSMQEAKSDRIKNIEAKINTHFNYISKSLRVFELLNHPTNFKGVIDGKCCQCKMNAVL